MVKEFDRGNSKCVRESIPDDGRHHISNGTHKSNWIEYRGGSDSPASMDHNQVKIHNSIASKGEQMTHIQMCQKT